MCSLCFNNIGISNNGTNSNDNFSALFGVGITTHAPISNEVKAIGGTVKWSSNNLDVSFATTSQSTIQSYVPSSSINNFSTNAKNGITEAFNLIDNVCNLNFNFLTDGNINAEILLWETSDDDVLGIALHGPSENAQYGLAGDTFVDVFAGTSVLNYESNFASNLG
jgi:hypothetical protein